MTPCTATDTVHRDPLESEIEAVLSPGRFIGWRAGSAFVAGLSALLDRIREAAAFDALRGLSLLETFLACCNEKAEEVSDSELQSLSHFTTEPAAACLEPAHPDLAARVHHALGMRIVDAGKSRYYDAALSHFDAAKRCYEQAGRGGDWEALVRTVREKHRRKSGFMPGFERIVSGKRVPSFVDSARARWLR